MLHSATADLSGWKGSYAPCMFTASH